MKVMVVRTDKLGRFKMGDIGEVLENDFEKYDYRVDLGPLPKSDMIGGIDGGRNIIYFYKDEVMPIEQAEAMLMDLAQKTRNREWSRTQKGEHNTSGVTIYAKNDNGFKYSIATVHFGGTMLDGYAESIADYIINLVKADQVRRSMLLGCDLEPAPEPAERFYYEEHHGGVVLYDRVTGNDVFFQPGDDAQTFRESIGEDDAGLQEVAPEYFNND